MPSYDLSEYSTVDIVETIRQRIKSGDIAGREYRVTQKQMQVLYLEHGEIYYAFCSVRDPHVLKHRRLCPGVYSLTLVPEKD